MQVAGAGAAAWSGGWRGRSRPLLYWHVQDALPADADVPGHSLPVQVTAQHGLRVRSPPRLATHRIRAPRLAASAGAAAKGVGGKLAAGGPAPAAACEQAALAQQERDSACGACGRVAAPVCRAQCPSPSHSSVSCLDDDSFKGSQGASLVSDSRG